MNDDNQMDIFHPADLNECELLEPKIIKEIESEEAKGKYTAVRLKKKRPEAYKAVLYMLSLNLPISQISKYCNIHYYTVTAVARAEPEIIAKAKENIANMSLVNSIAAQERITEMLANLDTEKANTASIYQLATASGIMVDKANLLQGGVTAKIQVETCVQFQGDMNEYAERFCKSDVVDVEVER